MRLPHPVISGFALIYLSVTAGITIPAILPRSGWDYCEFHDVHDSLRDIDRLLAPAVIATFEFLRRGYQACAWHLPLSRSIWH